MEKKLKEIFENIEINKIKDVLNRKELKTFNILNTAANNTITNDKPENFKCSDIELFRIRDLIKKLSKFAKEDKKEIVINSCNLLVAKLDKQIETQKKERPKIFGF